MLDKIFDMDNLVFRFFRIFGYVWWLNILWLICSLPLFTIGASTTALCFSCMKLREKDERVTRNFFASFRENFGQSTLIFLIMLAVGGVLGTDILLGSHSDSVMGYAVRCIALALLLPYGMTLLYVFAVQARFVNPVRDTLRYAFFLALRNLSYTIVMTLLVAAVIMLNTTIVLFNYISITIGMAAVIYIFSSYYNKIFLQIITQVQD